MPNAIVCLLSALRIHDIGTQAPHEVWLALDRKARKPTAPSGQGTHRPLLGRDAHLRHRDPSSMLGVPVRLTSPARTVVDCFRYRNKIGLDVALEALRDCGTLATKPPSDEIDGRPRSAAARTVMKTYLEAAVGMSEQETKTEPSRFAAASQSSAASAARTCSSGFQRYAAERFLYRLGASAIANVSF